MTTRRTTKALTPKEARAALKALGACGSAREAMAGKRSLAAMYAAASDDWLRWLVSMAATTAQKERLTTRAEAATLAALKAVPGLPLMTARERAKQCRCLGCRLGVDAGRYVREYHNCSYEQREAARRAVEGAVRGVLTPTALARLLRGWQEREARRAAQPRSTPQRARSA